MFIGLTRLVFLFPIPPARGGEKRILGASQDLEHLYSNAKGIPLL